MQVARTAVIIAQQIVNEWGCQRKQAIGYGQWAIGKANVSDSQSPIAHSLYFIEFDGPYRGDHPDTFR